MKRFISLLLILSLSLTLFGCVKAEEKEDNTTTEYVLPTPVVTTDISLPYTSASDFNPFKTDSALNRDLLPIIFESLYDADNTGKGKAVLASSGEITDKTVTVKIKQGLKFSDGSELLATHVKSSFEKAKNSDIYKSRLINIASVICVDNYTLKFTLSTKDDLAVNCLTFPVVKESKEALLGSGKYKISYLEDTPYLEVNTNHRDYSKKWNKQIALFDMAGITSPVYPFKANEISVYKQDLSKEYINLSSDTVSVETNNLVYIGINTKWAGSVTSVDYIRQAINIGIDRKTITASSFLGQGSAVVTPFKNEFYGIQNIELVGTEGNVEKAIGILERNGYNKTNSDGIRTNGSSGLRVDILVCTQNPYKLTVAESFKKQLEKLGFGVTVKKYSDAEAFTSALKEGHYSFYVGETCMTDNCDMSEFFTEGGALSYGVSDSMKENFKLYRNGEVTTSQFIESFSTEMPLLPLFYRKAVISVNPNVKGVDETGVYTSVNNWKL
ncbi:MAG: ABC transporter substrate-binding protein [Acutalibacteraceae bacterium]